MENRSYVEILLVEDNPQDAELALIALREENFANNIVWLKDGVEAIKFLFGDGDTDMEAIINQPKMILLDLKMPKVGGIEVLQRIRADERTKKIPVVVMTSSNEEKDIVAAYNLGVNSYIVKPLDFFQFTKSVKEIGYYWLLLNKTPMKGKD